MNAQIESSIDRIEDAADELRAGARGSLNGLVQLIRDRGQRAADTVAAGKRPLDTLSGAGLKLSAVSHRTTDRVLKNQADLTRHQLDLMATRIESAANASCLRDLFAKQIRLTPEQFAQLGRDARASLSIIVDGGAEARDVVRDTLRALAGTEKPSNKAARKARKTTRKAGTAARKTAKAAGKTARKTAKKAAAAGKTAKRKAKKTAKKVSAKASA